MNIKYIVTHPGRAHRDEFLAICLLLASVDNRPRILRKNPSDEEKHSKEIAVVDIGMIYDSTRLNFDHHQLDSSYPPTCSLTMILDHLGYLEAAKKLWPWLEATELLDSKGPTFMANTLGISSHSSIKLKSPIESVILNLIQPLSIISIDNAVIYTLMENIGESLLGQLEGLEERLKVLKEKAIAFNIKDVQILDTRKAISAEEDPTFGCEIFCRENYPKTELIISNDSRDNYISLFRRLDVSINLINLEGDRDVIFAHKNGFLAKINPEANVNRLIKKAINGS